MLQELLETESNYVEVLNMLRKHFIRPVSSIKVNKNQNPTAYLLQECTVHADSFHSRWEEPFFSPGKLGEHTVTFRGRTMYTATAYPHLLAL